MPPGPGPYSLGDRVSMADLYLVPQCANAARFGISPDDWPRLKAIVEACLDTEAARATRPEAVRPPR